MDGGGGGELEERNKGPMRMAPGSNTLSHPHGFVVVAFVFGVDVVRPGE
jgi:hypothetical protein